MTDKEIGEKTNCRVCRTW